MKTAAVAVVAAVIACALIGRSDAVTAQEKAALEAIYDGTGGGSWTARTNWKNGDPCGRWHGVVCDSSGHVLELNLGFNNLRGQLPSNIGELKWMRYLFLQNNVLTGSLPSGIGSLTALETMHLHNNRFANSVPSSIGSLSNLRVLIMFNNEFRGTIPSSIGSLANLERLYFNDNSFSGPVPSSISGMTNLKGFYGYNNDMSGALPPASTFEAMTSLLFFDMHNNDLVGPLPDRFSTVGATRPEVDLSDNNLDCIIPSSYTDLSHVVELSGNAGFLCPLPALSPAVSGVGECISMRLDSLSPTNGDINAQPTVEIRGTNFGQCGGQYQVRFGGTAVNINSFTSTSIFVTAPTASGVGNVPVGVYNSAGVKLSSNDLTYTFILNCPAWCTDATEHVSGCNTQTGECVCETGWAGVNCADTFIECPGDCNGRGTCDTDTGICNCNEGFGGVDCSKPDMDCTPVDCNGHGSCDRTTGSCVCNPPYLPDDCARRTCPSCVNGNCNLDTGECDCADGWAGVDCSARNLPCPTHPTTEIECSDHGVCNRNDGLCSCDPGWSGSACEFRSCPGTPACSGNGDCDTFSGLCTCSTVPDGDGFIYQGDDCSIPYKECTPTDCHGNGVCNTRTGNCVCNPPWFANTQCRERNCPGNCNGQGTCIPTTGVCDCEVDWAGDACNIANKTCGTTTPGTPCSGRGSCNKQTGLCVCESPWTAASFCSERLCPSGCSGSNGVCDSQTGECTCNEGFAGFDCSIADNECGTMVPGEECSGHGVCDRTTGTCVCVYPWFTNSDCGERPCPNNCNGLQGECIPTTGACNCTEGWTGLDCSVPFILCPTSVTEVDCSGNGNCDTSTGRCRCNPPYTGDDCSTLGCPLDCSNAGTCDPTTGTCECDEDRDGDYCEIRLLDCPTEVDGVECSGHGTCDQLSGLCQCDDGWLPAFNCHERTCPSNCNGRGTCDRLTGICECDEDYTGADCGVPDFDCGTMVDGLVCSGHGTCDRVSGTCQCEAATPPWNSNMFCGARSCPGLCNNGTCNTLTGQCDCDPGFQGTFCTLPLVECPNDCSGRGVCKSTFGVCDCYVEYQGEDCSECKAGYVTDEDVDDPPVDDAEDLCFVPIECDPICESSGAGLCRERTGICECLEGHHGPNCQEFECLNGCSGRGQCVDVGVCECNTGFEGEDCSTEIESAGSAVLGAAIGGAAVFGAAAGTYFYMRKRAIRRWREKMGVEMK